MNQVDCGSRPDSEDVIRKHFNGKTFDQGIKEACPKKPFSS
jgi:hypothetical protein